MEDSTEGGAEGEMSVEVTEGGTDDGSLPVKTGKQKQYHHNNNTAHGQGQGQGQGSDKKYKTAKPHQGCGRQPEPVSKLRRQLRMGANSLIIACRQQPLPILIECLALLTPSSPFVVYFEYMEPLVECYLYVTEVCYMLYVLYVVYTRNMYIVCPIYMPSHKRSTNPLTYSY